MANFDANDEIYYNFNMMPEAKVLAVSFHDVFTMSPQIWSYEKDNYRAVVSIPGHAYTTFNLPQYRALLMRAIAWTGKRENVDYLCAPEELKNLDYPEGGPMRAEKSREQLVVHSDFNMTLVATEPLINKPMNMDWDARGRLWVCETPEYPSGRNPPVIRNVEKGIKVPVVKEDRPARDRISILEDTNGDGLMDKKTVFFEGLELVTSFCFHNDGIIVAQAPDIYFIRDSKGGDKADEKITLYTGLGTGDSHSVINNLRWGHDGWIYATHGYSGGRVKSADGAKDFGNIGSGVVRFKADGSAFEQYCSKGGNTWGLDIAWDGEVFFTQPTSGDLLNHVVVPESVLAKGKVGKTPSFEAMIRGRPSFPLHTLKRPPYVQIDQVGRFTASAGCAVYAGGTWPEQWNNSYFTTEPQINLVHHEMITPKGATYTAEKIAEAEFIAGKDYWFRPIETRIGPDGALYIIDFYNQAITHNDTRGPNHSTRNAAVRPDRDHYYGRIWRVDHKQAKKIEIPKLDKATPAELAKALEHPNLPVRMIAKRLLTEKGAEASPDVEKLLANPAAPAYAQVLAMWILSDMNKLSTAALQTELGSADTSVRKVAVRVAARNIAEVKTALLARVGDKDARVALHAIIALSGAPLEKDGALAIVNGYAQLQNPWAQSAMIGLVRQNADLFSEAVFNAANGDTLAEMMNGLTSQIAASGKAESILKLLNQIATLPAEKAVLKNAALDTLAKEAPAVAWSDDVQKTLKALLQSPDTATSNRSLPLIALWDKQGAMKDDVRAKTGALYTALKDTKLEEKQRADVARNLLSLYSVDKEIIPALGQILVSEDAPGLKKEIVLALGNITAAEAGTQIITAFAKLTPDVQQEGFNQLLRRPEWSLALLEKIKDESIKLTTLGPANVHRLRTHPESTVSKRAVEVLELLRGPEVKEKNELLAKFTAIVEQPGDAVKGKQVFITNCATCHKFKDDGKEVGPILNGMGAHGPAELLVHILDPNRAIEPNFVSWVVKSKSGEMFDGIIVRENSGGITLRNATGEKEIKTADIALRKSTGMSLMPNGFESLGGEALRDMLTYICSADQKYRFVDLSSAFTADTRKGLYVSATDVHDTVSFAKFGTVSVEGVPFNIMDPLKAREGKNILVLKGGGGGSFSGKLPQKVEVKMGFPAGKLHFLGGIAGWGYPAVQEPVDVMKVTVHFAGGETQELLFKNGVEFADYIAHVDVPGSKLAKGVVKMRQMRWFSAPLKKAAIVEKLTLESFNNQVAPTTVAITAEMGGDNPNPPKVEAPKPEVITIDPKKAIRTLIVGGGSSHDFGKWFNQADRATLMSEGNTAVEYTDKPASILPTLKDINVLYLSTNQAMTDPEMRKGIFEFADSGKGLLLVHPALWYNWGNWPEYNKVLAGGGAKGHDKLGEFEVVVEKPDHPIMAGVPKTFKITDELYNFIPDEKGTPIEVLATAKSTNGKTFPIVWIVQHPKAKIVGITLGHDGRAHDHPAYKSILVNSLKWAAQQK